MVRRGRDRAGRQGADQASGRRVQRRAAHHGRGLDRRGRRLGQQGDDRPRGGDRRPQPAALPGAGRPAGGDAGTAQCRGRGRRLYRRDQLLGRRADGVPQGLPADPRPEDRRADSVPRADRFGRRQGRVQGQRPGRLRHGQGLSDPDPARLESDHPDVYGASATGRGLYAAGPAAGGPGGGRCVDERQLLAVPRLRSRPDRPVAVALSVRLHRTGDQRRLSAALRRPAGARPEEAHQFGGAERCGRTAAGSPDPRRGLRPVAGRRRRGGRLAGRLCHRLPVGGQGARRSGAGPGHGPGPGRHAPDQPSRRLGERVLPHGVSGVVGPQRR